MVVSPLGCHQVTLAMRVNKGMMLVLTLVGEIAAKVDQVGQFREEALGEGRESYLQGLVAQPPCRSSPTGGGSGPCVGGMLYCSCGQTGHRRDNFTVPYYFFFRPSKISSLSARRKRKEDQLLLLLLLRWR